ncbi:unnamed protein product [Rotaria socialis]|uniref:AB hydrolase-1 domain-containing protein n=1 Tax=Rotaria socialis TaxID=392032 RepID=A0A818T5Y5_9BILA|nr:unnamed protein product [Rotaria socialis]CAF3363867.1 unnamed protein product [Rotaria socialis]CAF3679208.1 unnamed protein product [Rotaria socialis]
MQSPLPQVKLKAHNFAYSDPCNLSSRTQYKHVVFERHDRETLSVQAKTLFNSRMIFESDAELEWLLENVHSTMISIKINDDPYEINSNYVLSDSQRFVLVLHGFDETESWTTWTKMIQPLSQRYSYSVIFVDLPGFGRSSGRDSNQTSWKRNGPEIIIAILSSFHIESPVNILATCGGSATIVRTINRYPAWFRDRNLIFTNSVIGDFGESKVGDFEKNLTQFNIHIIVHWFPDEDHTHHCVAYKRWNKLRQSGFRHVQLIDFDPVKQTSQLVYPEVRVLNIGRCSFKHKAIVYQLSEEYIQQIINTLSAGNDS